MDKMKKSILAILLVSAWVFVLSLVWWVFGPDTFWQRLVVILIECVIGLFSGIGAFFIGCHFWDKIDLSRKRKEANRRKKVQSLTK